MTDSMIAVNKGSTTFIGPDATNLYRCAVLRGAIKLWAGTGIIPTRGMTITRMLAQATGYSQKPYKRGEALKAVEDLTQWIEAMKAALPIEREEGVL